jgi:MFS family permease
VTSAVFIVEMLPPLFFGSVAGVFADRWDRRRALIIINGIQAVVLMPLLAVHSAAQLWIVYVVSLAEALLAVFAAPAESALLPRLVAEDQILTANSLGSLGVGLARLIGSPLGGVVVGVFSLSGVVVLDAVSFVFAALLIAGTRIAPALARAAEAAPAAARSFRREWLAGLRIILGNRRIAILFTTQLLQSVAQGIFLILYRIARKAAVPLGRADARACVGLSQRSYP